MGRRVIIDPEDRIDVKIQKSKKARGFKVNDVCFNRENTGNGE